MKKIVYFIFLFGGILNLSASNYYASPTGIGDGSSYSTPGSFLAGKSSLSTNDTLYLLGGQYNLSAKVSFTVSGSEGNCKVVASYPGEQAIFDFRNQPYGKEVTGSDNIGFSISEGVQYVHIKDIVLRYAGKAGILNQGMNCIFENCQVYGCGDTGIQMKKGGNNLIKNCDSYENFDYKTVTSAGDANYGGNADGFADKQYTTPIALGDAPNTYIGCRSWNNADDGWDFYERIGNSVITECIAYQNGPEYYDMTNHPRRLGVDSTWFKSFEGAGLSVLDRYGNTVTLSVVNYINWGNGNGFKIGGNYTAHNVSLNRCLSVGNSSSGFDKNNNAGKMSVFNGSAYQNKVNFGFGNASFGTLTIKNSLSYDGSSSDYFDAITLSSEHNSWNTVGVTCDNADFISADTTLILAARNTDGSLAITDFFRLVNASDLIDAGIDAKLSYSGIAPDLGCYEKGTIDQYPGVVNEPSNKNQTVFSGSAISDIVFTWSGGASGLVVSNLPAGITGAVDNTAKTLTLSGTVTAEAGEHTYTVTTVGGTAIADEVSGTIAVHVISTPSNANQIVITGTAITDIVFSWIGDATGLAVTGLPSGLITTLDGSAKTFTISGSVSDVEGTYNYTVSTEGGTGVVDTSSGTIELITPFNYTKYYNIYSYGIAYNSSKSIASVSDTKKFVTGDGVTNSVLLIEGTSDSQEQTNGIPDPLRATATAQWIISAGATSGHIIAKNRVTGTYLQLGSSLSSSEVQIHPVYKKEDNGNSAYAIFNVGDIKCMQVNLPTINTFTGYADRTRMRWIFSETEESVAGVHNATMRTDFLKYSLVSDVVELLNPENFETVEVININGQKVISVKVNSDIINVSGLVVGVYLVKGITKNGAVYVTKIFKN